jgi:predicted transcriptional regulator
MINNNRNSQLLGIIEKSPGIKFRELMRATGMKNGSLSHYVNNLEKIGSIQVKREPRQTRFFPLQITEEESKIIKALRRNTPREIIEALLVNEDLTFGEIVRFSSKSPGTVSLYVSQLVSDQVIERQLNQRKKTYRIKNRKAIDNIIEKYHPTGVDKLTSSFEDIINAL